MKHKTFEEWIFEEEIAEKEDQKALYDHLRDCDDCFLLEKNWSRVEPLLVAVPVAGPANGFAERWQARLALDRQRSAQRQNLVILVSTSVSAAMLLLMAGLQFYRQIADALSPVAIWASAFGRVGSLVSTFAVETFDFLMKAAPASFSMLLVMGFFASVGAAAILWLKMFRMLARAQGLTRWA